MSNWHVEVSSPGELDVAEFKMDQHKLHITPNFYGRGASANLAVMKVFDGEGKLLSMSLVTLNGVNGCTALKSLNAVTKPAMEKRKEKQQSS